MARRPSRSSHLKTFGTYTALLSIAAGCAYTVFSGQIYTATNGSTLGLIATLAAMVTSTSMALTAVFMAIRGIHDRATSAQFNFLDFQAREEDTDTARAA
jgi:hypothetical protein